MRTTKYTIQFESVETYMSLELPISKKHYLNELQYLSKLCLDTLKDEFPVEKLIDDYIENRTYTLHRIIYTSATGSIYLREYKCKEGYCFRK